MKRTIVLGITGGIAAYKAAELTSMLVKRGFTVHVIMTRAATEFITPLTLQTISQNPVHLTMFDPPKDWEIEHISLAACADLILVAPATANLIGKMAAGLADDLLSTTILATKAPVLIAPAMNVGMYENVILQRNLRLLRDAGYRFVEPAVGRLACGVSGKGRLADLDQILAAVEKIFVVRQDLSGTRVLVTAGPTREPLDPVRFLSNYSTGKMGYAIAGEARDRGAQVILVTGPTNLEPPCDVEIVPVETAQEMFDTVAGRYAEVDVVIKAAAVADFRPCHRFRQKIKKQADVQSLELEKTTDILQYLGENKQHQILVGFAAETEEVVANAQKKLAQKNLDLLVANDLTTEGAGFGVDTNVATLLFPGKPPVKLTKMRKKELARMVLDEVTRLLSSQQKDGDA